MPHPLRTLAAAVLRACALRPAPLAPRPWPDGYAGNV